MKNEIYSAKLRKEDPVLFVAQLASGEPPMHISILEPIGNPDIDVFYDSEALGRKILKLGKQTVDNLNSSGCNAYKVFVSEVDRSSQRPGVLVQCGQFSDVFQLILSSSEITSDVLAIDKKSWTNIEDLNALFGDWQEDLPLSSKDESPLTEFSMRPRNHQDAGCISAVPSSKISDISPKSFQDPRSFLLSRYYNTLYSLNTPLSYFPKTSLSRVTIMCEERSEPLSEELFNIYLTPELLEERHRSHYGLLNHFGFTGNDTLLHLNNYEIESQKRFISAYATSAISDDQRLSLLLKLKIREAQLQLLVIMELITALKIDEITFLKQHKKKGEEDTKQYRKANKSLLVRKRKMTKKIIPTFSGMGINESEEPELFSFELSREKSLYTSMITLVEQMSIWDTLLGRGHREKDQSPTGFLGYVFLPFYNKRLPQVTKFIADIIKELRPKFKAPKTKLSRSSSASSKVEETVSESSNIAEETNEITLLNSDKLNNLTNHRPALRRERLPFAVNDEEPAFLLKRSKSNISSRNLKRRQVDMSLNKSDGEEFATGKSKLFIFGDARKSRVKSIPSLPPSVAQVEATPIKTKLAGHNEKDDPYTSASLSRSEVIMATPTKNKTTVIPDSASGKSRVEKPINYLTKNTLADIKIGSSPIGDGDLIINSPRSRLQPPYAVKATLPQDRGSPLTLKLAKNPSLMKSPFISNSNGDVGEIDSLSRQAKKSSTFIISPKTRHNSLSSTSNHDTDADTETESKGPGFKNIEHSTDTDSDSDSEFEKLIASTSNKAIRQYSRKK